MVLVRITREQTIFQPEKHHPTQDQLGERWKGNLTRPTSYGLGDKAIDVMKNIANPPESFVIAIPKAIQL
jgi:hypothetical protein